MAPSADQATPKIDNDVYCGRGRVNYDKPGTKFWRKLIEDNLERYEEETDKKKKHLIANDIVTKVRNQNPPGRFLKKFEGKWTILHTDEAIKKCKEGFANLALEMRKGAGATEALLDEKITMADIVYAMSTIDVSEPVASAFAEIILEVGNVSLDDQGREGDPEDLEVQFRKVISSEKVEKAIKSMLQAQRSEKRQKLDEKVEEDKPVAGGGGGLSKMTPVDSQYVAPDFEMVSVMANVEIVKDKLLEAEKEYTGSVLLGKPHGSGCMKYRDEQGNYTGKVICGNWCNGILHGQGCIIFPNGSKCFGNFKNHKLDGKGVYMWPNESKYVGDFEVHKRHGDGRFVSEDKLIYDGQFKEGVFEGYGFVLSPAGDVIESGEFKNWVLVEEGLQRIIEDDEAVTSIEDSEVGNFELVEKG